MPCGVLGLSRTSPPRGEERRQAKRGEERTIEESARVRARDMRAITRHVSSICIQEDLSGEGGDGNGGGGGGGGGGERTTAVGDGCTTQIPPSV